MKLKPVITVAAFTMLLLVFVSLPDSNGNNFTSNSVVAKNTSSVGDPEA